MLLERACCGIALFLPLRTFLIFNSAALLYSRVNFGRNSTWVRRRFRLHLARCRHKPHLELLIHSVCMRIHIRIRSSKRTNEPIRSGILEIPEYISFFVPKGTSNFGMGSGMSEKKNAFFMCWFMASDMEARIQGPCVKHFWWYKPCVIKIIIACRLPVIFPAVYGLSESSGN